MSVAVEHGHHGIPMTKFVEIDIAAVRESKHNPRRHFDDEKLKQLAENIA